MRLSKEEFIKYCSDSNELLENELLKYYDIFPCECNNEVCKGWKIKLKKDALLNYYNKNKGW